MVASGVISFLFKLTVVGEILFTHKDSITGETVIGWMPSYAQFPLVVLITTIIWVSVTFLTQPETNETLFNFYKKIQPGGPGWQKTVDDAKADNVEIVTDKQPWNVPFGILAMLVAMIFIYSIMFATGYWIYGDYNYAITLTIVVITSGFILIRLWKKIKAQVF
jgi:hypothetical protein